MEYEKASLTRRVKAQEADISAKEEETEGLKVIYLLISL